jgi:hypothetical protein
MPRVKVWERRWLIRVDPDLAKHARVDIAHQDLANRIQAVSDVASQYVLFVLERVHSQLFVVVIIKVQCLANQVQAVKVMKALHVGKESSAVLVCALYKRVIQATLQTIFP